MRSPTIDPMRCCEMVRSPGMWSRSHQCKNKPQPGKPICWLHDPEYKAQKKQKATEKFREEMAANRKKMYAGTMYALLVESQKSIGGTWRERRDAIIRSINGH